MGAGEGEVLAHRDLGVRLADEALGPGQSSSARAGDPPGSRQRDRSAPRIVGSGGKSSWKPLYLVLQLFRAGVSSVCCLRQYHTAERRQGGAQVRPPASRPRRLRLPGSLPAAKRGAGGGLRGMPAWVKRSEWTGWPPRWVLIRLISSTPIVVQVHRHRAGAADGQHAAVSRRGVVIEATFGPDDDLPVRDDLRRGRVVPAEGRAGDRRHQRRRAAAARRRCRAGPAIPVVVSSLRHRSRRCRCCAGTTATGDGCPGGRSPARPLIPIASGSARSCCSRPPSPRSYLTMSGS